MRWLTSGAWLEGSRFEAWARKSAGAESGQRLEAGERMRGLMLGAARQSGEGAQNRSAITPSLPSHRCLKSQLMGATGIDMGVTYV